MLRRWLNLLFSFSGRIGRGDFWLGRFMALGFWLGLAVIGVAAGGPRPGDPPNTALVFGYYLIAVTIVTFWMNLAVNAKRLHDHNMSGWYGVAEAVPVLGWLWLLFIAGLAEGDADPNRYGPPTSGAIKVQEPSSPTKGKRKKKVKV